MLKGADTMHDRMDAPVKRILHLHFGKEGGAERFFVSLCKGFDGAGIEQRFLIRPGRTWRDQMIALGMVKEAHYPRFRPIRVLLQQWVNRQIRDWMPDAVIAWMPKAATLLPRAVGPARLVRLGDYPRHIAHFDRADCIVTNTPDIPNRLKDLGWTKPVQVISNFPRMGEVGGGAPQFDLPKDNFILCAAGRFVALKGFDTLIRAMAQVPNTALCLVGDGPERGKLQTLAQELGVQNRVHMTGWVTDPTRWIAVADLACVSSTHETLGNVVLEAWQVGGPVISTPTPGPSWLIKDGETGILVPDFTAESLAAGIRRAINAPDLRQRLVKCGAQKLATQFSKDAVVNAYVQLIAAYRGGYNEKQTPKRHHMESYRA